MTGHDPDTCQEKCTFVSHQSCIIVTPAQRQATVLSQGNALKALVKLFNPEDLILPVGRFTLPGWAGCAVWYLFRCRECDTCSVDYLHGHQLHLVCDTCEMVWYVRGRRFYADAGLPPPPTPIQQVRALMEMRRQLRDHPKPTARLPPPQE